DPLPAGPPAVAPSPSTAPPADPLPAGPPAGPPGWEQARPTSPDRRLPGAPPPARPGDEPPGTPSSAVPPGSAVPPSSALPPGDPRIGRPTRSGALLALLAVLAGLAATAPLVAVAALFGWMTAARTADRSVTSLVLRRHARGGRGSDIAVAVASGPWHLVVGVVGSLLTVLLPLVVGVCAMFSAALVLSGVAGDSPVRPDSAAPLAAAGIFTALTAWWGPGGPSLRRGSRSLVRGVTAHETVRQVVVGVVLVVAVALLAVAVTGGPSWWPSSDVPGWVADGVQSP
ncbi:MAG: serine/threonine-protein kinase, partial [Dermatophilaceae bacterium]